ncbi:MAG: ATP-binding protein [Desulfomonilaceae bacterium]
MNKATFKIRRKIILAFLFCFLSVLVFAILSFQIHREISHRLRLVEVADDLVNNILEIRRFEKNFFLYKQHHSLEEAASYVDGVERLYKEHEKNILRLTQKGTESRFGETLADYKKTLSQIKTSLQPADGREPRSDISGLEESLRGTGQKLLDIAGQWAKQERIKIDRLSRTVFYLFIVSMLFFGLLGILVAIYISRLMTVPLIQMQQAMEKIAGGDFTPIREDEHRSEEFLPLFRAFNRMIRELEERQEQLVQARKISAIGTFTSGIAHELNNPVNNIVLTAEAFQEDFEELDHDEALGMIQDILAQADRASEIVKNLLDFSRSERPEMVSVSIRSVIDETLKLVGNQMLVSRVEAEKQIPKNFPSVHGDYKSLQQVFLNLFINAIHAMPNGGKMSIRGYLSNGDRFLRVEVSDTGIGIEPEHIPLIFDPFYTTKDVGKGTGLGLSVTYSILQKHGGTVEVQSEKGRGTTFTVILPTESTK